jgi:hypothetical protein
MRAVNVISAQIRLRDFMQNDDGWGIDQGKQVYAKIKKFVESIPGNIVFQISFKGVQRTDASFSRESIVRLAKDYRRSRGFCVIDVSNQELLDNLEAAAMKLSQPITVWEHDKPRVIGPLPSNGTREMFEYVMSVPVALTSEAAVRLRINISNASNKLKKLWDDGYILRRQQIAASGGVEFEYFRVR